MGAVDAAGIVHVFTSTVSGLTALEDADLQLYGDVFFAYVGHDLFKAGDINGDGLSDLLVVLGLVRPIAQRSWFQEIPPCRQRCGCRMPQREWMEIPIKQSLESLRLPGDINGDGYGDLAIGAKEEDISEVDSGSVHIYYGPLAGVYEGGDYHGVMKGES